MEKINVNKSLLIALVALSAASVLVVAFLLGRSTAPAASAGDPSRDRTAASYGSETRSTEGSIPAQVRAATPLTDSPGEPPPAAAVTFAGEDRTAAEATRLAPAPPGPGPATATVASTGATDPAAADVARYLDAVDQIQPANVSGGPESIASEMAAALTRGDTSGLDGMIRQSEAARERLAALRPPAPCATHYRETLGSLDDALDMLRALKAAMASSDPSAGLASVVSRATTLRSRAEALQGEDRALRQRYGLTR